MYRPEQIYTPFPLLWSIPRCLQTEAFTTIVRDVRTLNSLLLSEKHDVFQMKWTKAKTTFKSFPELLLFNVRALLVHALFNNHFAHLRRNFPEHEICIYGSRSKTAINLLLLHMLHTSQCLNYREPPTEFQRITTKDYV